MGGCLQIPSGFHLRWLDSDAFSSLTRGNIRQISASNARAGSELDILLTWSAGAAKIRKIFNSSDNFLLHLFITALIIAKLFNPFRRVTSATDPEPSVIYTSHILSILPIESHCPIVRIIKPYGASSFSSLTADPLDVRTC
jgi:hypothetical protein